MKNLLIAIFAVIITGCAGVGGSNVTAVDRFTNTTINQTEGNDLPNLADNFTTYFDVRQEIHPSSVAYSIRISSFSFDGSILTPQVTGESLYVIADDNRMSFSVSGQQGRAFIYPAIEQQIRSICYATNVEIRVILPDGIPFEKKLSAQNRSNLKKFADKFMR